MKPKLEVARIEDSLEWLASSAELATSTQSIAWFIDHISDLAKTLAWLNGQMAVANECLNNEKVNAYQTLVTSSVANQKYYAPSLAKEYISAKVSNEQYAYDIAERASRTCTHQLDVFRSCLSCLKEEMKVSQFQQ